MSATIAAVQAGSSVDPCCCNAVPCSLVGQYKSGIAALIGHSEHPEHVSYPPRKYLFRDYGGTMHCKVWTMADPPCGALALDCIHSLLGGCHYSATTGLIVQNDGQRTTLGPSNPDYCTPGDYPLACDGWLPGPLCTGYDCGATIVTTATSMIRTGDEGPCQGCGDAWARHTITGSNSVILSNEDAPANAKARAEAGKVWTACGLLDPCSSYTLRDPDTFNVAYRHVQVQAHLTGLTVGRSYKVKIIYAQRILGTGGPFIPDGDYDEITFTASAVTWDSSWYDVPDNDGWETISARCQTILMP